MTIVREIARSLKNVVSVAFVIVAAIVLAREALWSLASPTRVLATTGIASLAAIALDVALRMRLRFFQMESLLSPAALAPRFRNGYRLRLHLVSSVAACAALCIPDAATAVGVFASWWLSLVPAQLLAFIVGVRDMRIRSIAGPWLRMWRSRHAGAGALPVLLALAGGIALAGFSGANWATYLAAAAVLATIAWYSPVDHGVVNFERMMGHSSLRSLARRLVRPAGMSLLSTAVAALTGSAGFALLVVATTGAVLLYRAATVQLARFLPAHQVGFAMLVILFAAFATAFAVPFAAPVLLLALVGWMLVRSGRTTWLIE
ncbi:hypothetical protein KX816_04645 [Sphingosinicellaceae bacterium]|nr:hypothetical protein KX816_04645 [Sphingosinicellaceae bacterium]